MSTEQDLLWDWFSRQNGDVVVAFSGGVDSSVLAKSAVIAFQKKRIVAAPKAILAVSPTNSRRDVEEARKIADEIGISLSVLPTNEIDDANFVQNDKNRCYYCKKIRFSAMLDFVRRSPDFPRSVSANERSRSAVLLEGSNADDRNDYRPGRRAVLELKIASPFLELNVAKSTIRRWASDWGLSVAQKPSNPCLATRLAYGIQISNERLRRIDRAEEFLRSLSFSDFRVRLDSDDSARIEIPENQFQRLLSTELRRKIVEKFKQSDFQLISVDLEAFRSGKMNFAVEPEISEQSS